MDKSSRLVKCASQAGQRVSRGSYRLDMPVMGPVIFMNFLAETFLSALRMHNV